MAEAIFKARMPEGWKRLVEVSSAGTVAWEGQPASHLAIEVLEEAKIDLSAHRSRVLTREMIVEADVVVVMEHLHGERIRQLTPDLSAPVVALGDLDEARAYPDIDDPIGGDRAMYERSRDELSGFIDLLIVYLAELFDLER